jgi:amidase
MTMLPTVGTPSTAELVEIADDLGFKMSGEDADGFQQFLAGVIPSYWHADKLVEPRLPVRYPRDSGFRPDIEDNPLNAWYWRCRIDGAEDGVLKGLTVALKDNICLAGIPMMNGSRILEGFVPDQDATVVSRILDAGGRILGKAACEDLCMSGGSHTSALGMIGNPHEPSHCAGGSSGGSAALLGAGVVDVAMGGDQGGSITIPASFCGVYGLKASYGLVPYSGILPLDTTIDHAGPMASTTEGVARLLTAIAGPDDLDPRQGGVVVQNYLDALAQSSLDGVKIGVIGEGFEWPESDPAVDRCVRQASARFAELGASVQPISIPQHRDGRYLADLVLTQGVYHQVIKGNAFGLNTRGHYMTGLADHFGQARRARPNDFPHTVKAFMMLAEYIERRSQTHYYAKGQNLSRRLRDAYNDALSTVDLLVFPTTPMVAPPLPAADCSVFENLSAAFEMVANTTGVNLTGHPAMSIPCGKSDADLPVGMMLVGRHFDEITVLRASHGFEQLGVYQAAV